MLFKYRFPDNERLGAGVNLGGGTSVDRFSAYRLGGMLINNAEFPLTLPGYFSQEIAAERVAHMWVTLGKPLTAERRVVFNVFAAGATIKPVPSTDAGGSQHLGFGMGMEFAPRKAALHGMASYGYAPTAARGSGRGGHGVALSLELNLGTTPPPSGHTTETQGGLRWLLGSSSLP